MISQEAEYASLRAEISTRVTVSYQISIFAYTAVAAIWALMFQAALDRIAPILWPTVLGIAIWICLFSGKLTNQNTRIIVKIAAYLKEFYEDEPEFDSKGKLTTVSWERMLNKNERENSRPLERFEFKDPYASIMVLANIVMAVSLIPFIILAISLLPLDVDLVIFDIRTSYSPLEWAIGIVAYIACVLIPYLYAVKYMNREDVYKGTYGRMGEIWADFHKNPKE